jgi:hypothetical protein
MMTATGVIGTRSHVRPLESTSAQPGCPEGPSEIAAVASCVDAL